uniref:Uncharacterized protein n=1 Tax=Kryptolebias marmoratus TaxID=37003 RepID=A0A3Q3GM87_KRYMA
MERLLFALVAAALVSPCSGDYTDFCHGQPCPEYTVLETNDHFEKRSYVATSWISTTLDGTEMFQILKAKGKLETFWKEAELPDSWPILITRREAGGGDALSLSWFLPPGFEPQFSDTSVHLERRDAATVYVRTYSGFPSTSSGLENGKILRDALTEAGIPFDSQTSTGAFFESLFSISFERRNEIWLYGS